MLSLLSSASVIFYSLLSAQARPVAPVPNYVKRQASLPANCSSLKTVNGDVKPNSFIVKVADNVTGTAWDNHISWVSGLVTNSSVSNATAPSTFNSSTLHGYTAELDNENLATLLASSSVDWVEENAIMKALAVQTDAPWGLSRMSQAEPLAAGSSDADLTFTYTSNDTAGQGVDVYVLDTGIFTEHKSFGGRATFAFAATGLPQEDDNGHGSHVAGTVGSTDFGVAKNVNLFAVKVLDADGSGNNADIIDGISFIMQAAAASGNPSAINISLGGAPTRALDQAVTKAVAAGIHVVCAAGNEAADASTSSPGRVAQVITVGAVNIQDTLSSFSNFGAGVDVLAPGENVISVGTTSDTSTLSLSGTSMATPHITGLVASLLSADPTLTPAQMSDLIRSLAVQGDISGVPRTTDNLLAQTGFENADAATGGNTTTPTGGNNNSTTPTRGRKNRVQNGIQDTVDDVAGNAKAAVDGIKELLSSLGLRRS